MLMNLSAKEQIWNTLQEPRCPSFFPNGYFLLLSALDNGWKVSRIEIQPSWDQHGFVYLLTLKHPAHPRCQELVLPKNPQVENLLVEHRLSRQPIRLPMRLQA